MLPTGFEWKQLGRAEGPFVSLRCAGTEVARMCARVDGAWLAALNQHLDWSAPSRSCRPCSSWDAGRQGVELWASRYAGRIRSEVDQVNAARPWQPFLHRPPASVKFEGGPSSGGGSTGSPP